MIAGTALVLATGGAATAGYLLDSNVQSAKSLAADGSSLQHANSARADATPDGRSAAVVSRSGFRPGLDPRNDPAAVRAAVQRSRVEAAARRAVAEAAARKAAAEAAARKAAARRAVAEAAAHRAAARRAAEAARAEQRASQGWVLPTTGFHITVWFGEAGPYWSSGYHTGIDFATAYGTPVVAVTNGTVVQAGWDGAYGNQIRLELSNGDQVWYNHLSAIEVSVGAVVVKGHELGRVGDTGNAYGAHLHFEYRLAADLSTAVDPAPFFDRHGIHLS